MKKKTPEVSESESLLVKGRELFRSALSDVHIFAKGQRHKISTWYKKVEKKSLWNDISQLFTQHKVIFIPSILLVLGLIFGIFFVYSFMEHRLALKAQVGDEMIWFPYEQEIESLTKLRGNSFLKKPIQFVVEKDTFDISSNEIGGHLNEASLKESIKNEDRFLNKIITTLIIPSFIHFDEQKLEEELKKRIIRLQNGPKNASIALIDGKFTITPSQIGATTDWDALKKNLESKATTYNTSTIVLNLESQIPDIVEKDLENSLSETNSLVSQTLSIQSKIKTWNIKFTDHKDWIHFSDNKEKKSIDVSLKADSIKQYFKDVIHPQISQRRQDLIIDYNGGGYKVSGTGVDGYAIDVEKSITTINQAIANKKYTVEVDISFDKAKVIENGENRGIQSLLAIGTSQFTGSSADRIQNIKAGMRRFQNIMLAPGEEFSFLKFLGPVTAATGFVEELVIKSGGTDLEKEIGGGLCQVSSTVYRAALNAGLPITVRRNHSLLISYYKPHGLDATIYDPSQDFRFRNDTPGHILIQNYVDTGSATATFKIWGTDDGRKTKLVGPKLLASSPKPGSSIEKKDPSLPPGTRKLRKPGTGGSTYLWTRYVDKPGQATIRDDFKSTYKPIADFYIYN